MKDLILTDDHRIASDRHAHRVMDRLLAGQRPAIHREFRGEARSVVRVPDLGLHTMTRLQHEGSAGQFPVQCRCEPLTLDGWDVTRMSDERDDRHGWRFVHASRSSPVRSAIGRGRPPLPAALVWPVIVATSNRSIARSAVSSRSVVSAVSNPRRRAATASS
jgi:hypothetical protein